MAWAAGQMQLLYWGAPQLHLYGYYVDCLHPIHFDELDTHKISSYLATKNTCANHLRFTFCAVGSRNILRNQYEAVEHWAGSTLCIAVNLETEIVSVFSDQKHNLVWDRHHHEPIYHLTFGSQKQNFANKSLLSFIGVYLSYSQQIYRRFDIFSSPSTTSKLNCIGSVTRSRASIY